MYTRSVNLVSTAHPRVLQQQIFEEAAKPIADACLAGFNGTVFAYGQTGSGKTYTVHGPLDHVSSSNPQTGLMSRTLDYVFQKIRDAEAASGGKLSYTCKVNFLEIYNERVYDLLDENSGINAQTGDSLTVREHKVKGVFVEGLREEVVGSAAEAQELVVKGMKSRSVGATLMNRDSSRSHCVFTLVIESAEKAGARTKTRSAIFRLIDLAGSERQKATQAAGERLKEAGQINKSLSALCGVIQSLVEINQGAKRHVHYRDSKLTHLLKDSLGGNSRTVLIATVSPTEDCTPETLSTLRFASMAKRVRNKAVANEDSLTSVAELSRELKAAQETVKEYERQFGPLLKVADLNGSIDGDADMMTDAGASSSSSSSSSVGAGGASSTHSSQGAGALNEGAALLQAWEANFLQYVRASKGDAAVTAMRQGQVDSSVSVLASLQVLKQVHERVNRQGPGAGTVSCVLAHAAAAYDMMTAKTTADAVLLEAEEADKVTLASLSAAAAQSNEAAAHMLGRLEELKASTEAALAALQAKAAELGGSSSTVGAKQSVEACSDDDMGAGVEGECRSAVDNAENIPVPTTAQAAAEMGSSVRSTTSTTSTASTASKFGVSGIPVRRPSTAGSIVGAHVGAKAAAPSASRRPSVSSTGGNSVSGASLQRRTSVVAATVGNLQQNTAKPAAPAPTGFKLGGTTSGSSGPTLGRRPSMSGPSGPTAASAAAVPKVAPQPKDEFLAMLEKFSRAWEEAKACSVVAQVSELQAQLESTRAAVAAAYSALASKDRTALSDAQLESLRADFLIVKKSAWSTLSQHVRSVQGDSGKWEDMVSYLAQGPLLMQARAELQAARSELDTLAASKSMLNAERAGLLEQHAAMQQAMEALQAEKTCLLQEHQRAAEQQRQMHEVSLQAAHAGHASTVASMACAIEELQGQHAKLLLSLADKDSTITALQVQLQQAQAEVTRISSTLASTEVATASLQSKLQAAEGRMQVLTAEVAEGELGLQTARGLISSNGEAAAASEAKAAAVSTELAAAKASLEALGAEVAGLRAALATARAQLAEAEVSAVEAVSLRAQVNELTASLASVKEVQASAEAAAQQAAERAQLSQAQLEQAREHIAAERGEWEMERATRTEERASLAAQLEVLQAQASKGNAASSAEVEALRSTVSALQARTGEVEERSREADEEICSLTTQLEAAQAASSAAENALIGLEAVVDQAKSEAAFQIAEAEEAKALAAAAQAALAEAGESIKAVKAEMEATVAGLQQEVATQEQLALARRSIGGLEEALTAARADALAQADASAQALAAATSDIAGLQAQLTEAGQRVSCLQGELGEAKEEADSAKGRLIEMEAQLEDSERITRNLSEQLEEALAGKSTTDVALNTSLPYPVPAPVPAKPATADTATSPVQALSATVLFATSAVKLPTSALRPAAAAPPTAVPMSAMGAILATHRSKRGSSASSSSDTAASAGAAAQHAKAAGPSMQTIQEDSDSFAAPCTQPVGCAPTPVLAQSSVGLTAPPGSAVGVKTTGTKRSFAAMKDGNAGAGGMASPTPMTKRFHSARGLLAEVGGDENGSSTAASLGASMLAGPGPLLDAAATTINVPAIEKD